jgi:O-antigen/teichoic acid export membrane protein
LSSGSSSLGSEVRSSAAIAGISWGERAIAFVGQLLLVRFISVADYGAFTSAVFAALLVSLVATSGASVLVVARLSRSRATSLPDIWRLVRGFAGATIGLLGVSVVLPSLGWFPAALILGLATAVETGLLVVRLGLFGAGRHVAFGVASVGTALLRFTGLALGAWLGGTAWSAAAGMVVAALVAVAAMAAWTVLERRRATAPATLDEPVVDSVRFYVAALFSFLYFRQDIWVVQTVASADAAGQYGLFLRVHEAALALPGAYASISLRRVAMLRSSRALDRAAIRRIGARAFPIALAGVILMLGISLIDLGRLQPEYRPVGSLLRMSAWLYLPMGLSVVLQALLYGTDRPESVAWALGLATVVGGVLSVAGTLFWGLDGAVLAKVATECVLVIALAAAWSAHEPDGGELLRIAAVVCAVALGAAWLMHL